MPHEVSSPSPGLSSPTPVDETHDDNLHRHASEPGRRPSSSGRGLRRIESREQRIGTILERGLARAQTNKSDPTTQSTTTRMEPLLSNAPRQRQYQNDTSDDDGLDIGGPGRNGGASKPRDSGSQPNYQTINAQQQQGSRASADRSTIHRRSTASNHNRRRGTAGNTAGQKDAEADGHKNEEESDGDGLLARVKATMAMFTSVELDNKGSVARDHLALERTFLAWLRTSVSFASIGIAVTQLFRLNTSINTGRGRDGETGHDLAELRRLGKPLGAAFLGISILILFLGYGRYVRGQRWVMAGRFPASRGTVIIVTLLTFTVMKNRNLRRDQLDAKELPKIPKSPNSVMLVAEQVPAFAAAQLSLLAAEQEAEAAGAAELISGHTPAALQRAGAALTNLTVQGRRTGAGGRTVMELSSDPAVGGSELPEHGLRVGDVVLVAEQPAGSAKKREARELERSGVRGVVTRVRRSDLSVALDAPDDKSGAAGKEEKGLAGRVWVVRLADDVTYRRMTWTMEKMQKMVDAEHSSFIRVLFGHSSPSPVPSNLETDPDFGKLEWLDPTLNDSQKDAIRFALASQEIALIHGPPGTGKTHTLIELILQMLKRGLRILVCGPSNISVDNIVERLAPHKVPIVRLGHPARLLPSVVGHSLDVLTQTSEAGAIVRDVRAEMDAKQASIKKTKSGRERKAIYGELHELRKEFRDREKRCVANLLQSSKVVLATLHGSGGFQLRQEKFDVVIIDEASQALEAQCWVALLSAKKAVLAGDHLQLPPTIKSLNSKIAKPVIGGDGTGAAEGEESPAGQSRKKKGVTLETTLFDRLLDLHGPAIKRMLTTQYRMHEKIMRFPSDELYGGKLVAAEAVKERLLKDLPYEVEDTDDTREPLIFIDTQGGDFPERSDEMDSGDADDKKKTKRMLLHGESKSNEMEAALVAQHVRSLVDAGVKPEDIACITPYNAQLAVLAPLLKDRFPGIELGSVDGFQGREKEAVVVSLCRSNPDGEVGFLGEKRRLNAAVRDYTWKVLGGRAVQYFKKSKCGRIAMTRPKRSLTVIGDSETPSVLIPGLIAGAIFSSDGWNIWKKMPTSGIRMSQQYKPPHVNQMLMRKVEREERQKERESQWSDERSRFGQLSREKCSRGTGVATERGPLEREKIGMFFLLSDERDKEKKEKCY
ncbi:hypothetical protein PpBr36_08669, partial [Pyricularia pennisetigena]|uniref:hypothetical protein n=1 Tax=Pyricularia pennisetigena TaxID=1578925 RepID=UPI00114F8E22